MGSILNENADYQRKIR